MVDFATLLLPGSFVASFAVMEDAFALAEERRVRVVGGYEGREGLGDLRHRVLTPDGAEARLAPRTRVMADSPIASTDRFAMIWVPAFRIGLADSARDSIAALRPVAEWLAAMHGHGTLIAGSGTAALLFASAGLLRDVPVPVDPALLPVVKALYPRLSIDRHGAVRQGGGMLLSRGIGSDLETVTRGLEQVLSPETGHWLRSVWGAEDMDGGPVEPDPVVAAARLRLEQGFTQDQSIAALAADLAISQAALIRRFRAATGTTPGAYRQDLRIAAAKRMLARSTRTVEDIAARLGYSDVRVFRDAFRIRTGQSATAWRAAQTKGASER